MAWICIQHQRFLGKSAVGAAIVVDSCPLCGAPEKVPHVTTATIQPGLIALHSNRTEALADTVFAWLRQHPLGPLEEDIVLVQSNGVAEWFKMALASNGGVCAAARVELPSRFLWRTYRQVLGRSNVPAQSPVDKTPLTWRLMQLLP